MEQEIQRKQAPCPVVGVRLKSSDQAEGEEWGCVGMVGGGSQDGGGGQWAEPGTHSTLSLGPGRGVAPGQVKG